MMAGRGSENSPDGLGAGGRGGSPPPARTSHARPGGGPGGLPRSGKDITGRPAHGRRPHSGDPMKLNRATTYAVHALAYLAARKSPGLVASHDIAKANHIPEKFMLKVLHPLVSARL